MEKRDKALWHDLAGGEGEFSGPGGSFKVQLESNAACSEACPAGVDIKSYINQIGDRRFEEAVSIIRAANPFPGVCGRVCTHPCEEECRRGEVDSPLAIRELKRFAADYELSRKPTFTSAVQVTHHDKIAVIGGGPAGLTAASDLARAGFPVTVFESGPEAGGILSWGIPDFRLPKAIVRNEVRDIAGIGVEIKTNYFVENPEELLDSGFSAVILTTGSQLSSPLGIEGEESEGVLDCLEFLMEVSTGSITALPGKVVVVGGGSAALDSARTAVRLGSEVVLAYRRTEEEMPAESEEIEEAKEEGVVFEFLSLPTRVGIEEGKIARLDCQRARLGEPDESGRRRPVPVPDDFFTLEADWIIRAIGSKPDLSIIQGKGIDTSNYGTVIVDDWSQTSRPGIFAAGDLVLGPATIVDAIGTGHSAANGVITYLTGEPLAPLREAASPVLVLKTDFQEKEREGHVLLPAEVRRTSFDETNPGWEEISALAEASRCRRCGSCSGCHVCLSVCHHKQAVAIDLDTDESILTKIPLELSELLTANADTREVWTLNAKGESRSIRLESITAVVEPELCTACGLCDEVCAYRAIRVKFVKGQLPYAEVDHAACRSCGACSAVCPSGAIDQGFMDDSRLFEKARDPNREDGLAVFSCIWNGKENIENAVELTCTRRASPGLILEAFASGANGVALVGCGESECHYLPGPWMGESTTASVKEILEVLNIGPERVRYIKHTDDIESMISDFSEELSPLETPFDIPPPVRSTLGRSLDIALAMDKDGHEINIINTVLKAYMMTGLDETARSAWILRDTAQIPDISAGGMKVGYHASKEAAGELLGSVSDLEIQEFHDDCGNTNWHEPSALNSQKAVDLLKSVEKAGLDLLIVDNPHCLAHLKSVQMGWCECNVRVMSVDTFLLRLMEGKEVP